MPTGLPVGSVILADDEFVKALALRKHATTADYVADLKIIDVISDGLIVGALGPDGTLYFKATAKGCEVAGGPPPQGADTWAPIFKTQEDNQDSNQDSNQATSGLPPLPPGARLLSLEELTRCLLTRDHRDGHAPEFSAEHCAEVLLCVAGGYMAVCQDASGALRMQLTAKGKALGAKVPQPTTPAEFSNLGQMPVSVGADKQN